MRSSLTKKVYDIILADENIEKELTTEEITEALGVDNSQKGGNYAHVNQVLSHLVRKGYLERKEFSADRLSDINLTEAQRSVILELLTIIDNFQNQNPQFLIEGRELLSEIVASPEKVTALMRKAKEHSSQADKKRPTEETANELLYLISANPGITSRELQTKFPRAFTIGRITNYLTKLKRSNQITAEVVGGAFHYQIVEHKNSL